MTIKELYKWAVDHKAENYDIYIQYRDGGGHYYGSEYLSEYDIEINRELCEVTL